MKYLRLHKCPDEPSLVRNASYNDNGDIQNPGKHNKKVKSLIESMHRVISARARKHQYSSNVSELEPQKRVNSEPTDCNL